jgi:hypothetical protein
MTTNQTGSLLWLWILQIAWWLASMLPLAVAVMLIALGFRWLHHRARDIETKPVEAGPGGFKKVLRDKFSHLAIGQSMLFLILGGLALGGLLALFLQSFIQPEVQKVVEKGDLIRPEVAAPAGHGLSFDLISLLALMVGAVTVGWAVHTYRSLCRRAAELAGSLTGREASRPLLVRWFHDSKKMGLVALVLGGWVCFGLIMQVLGFILLVVPWPASLTKVPLAWATTGVIMILVAGSVVLVVSLYAPGVWMGVRNFKLDIRFYRGNPTFKLIVNVVAALGAGSFGALVFMNLLYHLGIVPRTGQWFDFTLALWGVAYVLAYAAAILVQILVCRARDKEFNLVNIALALVIALPGAVPIFILLFFLLSHFLARLFGQA